MLFMIIMFFNIYGKDMAGMNTELMLSGTSKSSPVVKMIVIGLFLAAMLCIPTFCRRSCCIDNQIIFPWFSWCMGVDNRASDWTWPDS